MAKINVEEIDKDNFLVTVSEDSETKHKVRFSDDYWKELCDKKISKKECIKRAFQFLLEREPKESILRQFDMTVIRKYFPEFRRKSIM